MVITAKDLEYLITIENVNEQIEDEWFTSFVITRNIIGESIWNTLGEWDKKILITKTHKLIIENKLLRN